MSRLVFLLEEPSMRDLLEGLLPRVFPNLDFLCIPHRGKTDLERSIPRKLRGWGNPGDRFVIVRDNDGGNCLERKENLRRLCHAGRRDDVLIRIVCQELESWYIGDPDALAAAFGNDRLRHIRNRTRYRDPDVIAKPSRELRKLVPGFGKSSGARLMANHLTRDGNSSRSFAVFLDGVANLHGAV